MSDDLVQVTEQMIKDTEEMNRIITGRILDTSVVSETTVKPNMVSLARTSFTEKIVVPLTRGGVESYFVGAQYPFKGYLYPGACNRCHEVKRAIRVGLEIALFPPFTIVLVICSLLPWVKYIMLDRIVERFVFWANTVLKEHYITPYRFCRSGRELYQKGIEKVKGNKTLETLIRIICMIWEYDDSYRYRGQDLFSEMKKGLLVKNPRKELLRVWNLGISREQDGNTKRKRKMFKWVLIYFSFVYSKLFREIVAYLTSLDLEEVKLDAGDLYDCSRRDKYDFAGMTFGARFRKRQTFDLMMQEKLRKVIKQTPKVGVVNT